MTQHIHARPAHRGAQAPIPKRTRPGAQSGLQKSADASGAVRRLQRIIQRHPAANGVPGNRNLAAGTTLVHGTSVQAFTGLTVPTSATPTSPAWFAFGSRFSAHVSDFMHPSATTHLHNYVVAPGQALNLMLFHDVPDLDLYMQSLGYPGKGINAKREALLIRARNPAVDGYMLEQDAVRGDPEVILFVAGLAKLQSTFRSELDASETRFGDDMDVGARTRLTSGGTVRHLNDRADPGRFETRGDEPGGRPRAQSL